MKVKVESHVDEVLRSKDEKLQTAMEAVALTAESYAKIACPVDTGRLRNSISHTSDAESATIGTNVEYAIYVEMGSSQQAPDGYLGIALTEHLKQYQQMIENELNRK